VEKLKLDLEQLNKALKKFLNKKAYHALCT